MISDKRMVLEYEEGVMTFRHFMANAGIEQLLNLSEAINGFQEEEAKRVLLVTAVSF